MSDGTSWVTVQRGGKSTMFPIARVIATLASTARVVGRVVFVGCITKDDPKRENFIRMELTVDEAEKLVLDLAAAVKEAKDRAGGGA